jgi:hypothetical protein
MSVQLETNGADKGTCPVCDCPDADHYDWCTAQARAVNKQAPSKIQCIWRAGCDGIANCQEAGCCLGVRSNREQARQAPTNDPSMNLLREWHLADERFDLEDWSRRVRNLVEDAPKFFLNGNGDIDFGPVAAPELSQIERLQRESEEWQQEALRFQTITSELNGEIELLETRLEVFDDNGERLPESCDGIASRDATIHLMDERIERHRDALAHIRQVCRSDAKDFAAATIDRRQLYAIANMALLADGDLFTTADQKPPHEREPYDAEAIAAGEPIEVGLERLRKAYVPISDNEPRAAHANPPGCICRYAHKSDPMCTYSPPGLLHAAPRDRPIWICSVCNGWNHVRDTFCTHTHAGPQPANGESL